MMRGLLISCLLIGCVCSLSIKIREAGTGSVAVDVDLRDKLLPKEALLLRVFDVSERPRCDPSAYLRPLDAIVTADMARSRAWKADVASDAYTTLLSPARLRQQFVGLHAPTDGETYVQGAVMGGSVAAQIYACVYDRDSYKITDETTPPVVAVAKSSTSAPAIDVVAYVQSPGALTADGAEVAARMLLRTYFVSGCNGGTTRTPGYLVHVNSKIQSILAKMVNQPYQERDEIAQCTSYSVDGMCLVCEQDVIVTAPIEEVIAAASSDNVLDILSKFILMTPPSDCQRPARPFVHCRRCASPDRSPRSVYSLRLL
jgi:hypothetical protein